MKTTWKDASDRQWDCRLTLAENSRLKAAGLDLFEADNYQRIFGDALTQVETFAEIMRPQWERAGLTYEQFAELIIETDGRLVEIQNCIKDAIADFCRRLGKSALANVVEKAHEFAARVEDTRLKRIDGEDLERILQKALDVDQSEFDARVKAAEQALIGATLQNAPESSEATTAPLPTAN